MKKIIIAAGIFLFFSLFFVISAGKIQAAEGPLQVPVVTCEERLSNNTFVVGMTVKWITPLKLSTYVINYQFFNLSTQEVYAFANANPWHPNPQVFQIDNEVNVPSGTVIAGTYRIQDKYGFSDFSSPGTATCIKGLPTPTPTAIPTSTPTPMPTQTPGVIVQTFNYPIKELGNCKDKEDCKKYCDLDENFNACNEWAVKEGLRTREEAERLRNARNVKSGPGGCDSQENCAAYCDKPENLNVCLEYAEKNNLMSADELDKTKKVLKVISSGSKTPGDCKTPKACRSYCTGDEHVNECLEFGKAAGVLSEDETKKGKDLLENGGPGGCKTREQCEAYCDDEIHLAECDAFMEKAGVADRKARDNSGKPPNTGGGAVCNTQEECEAFCKNPANAESCKNVVMKGGKVTGPETTGDMGKMLEDISKMPEESRECLRKALGEETFEKLMKGEQPEKPISGDVKEACFAQGIEEYEKKAEPTKKPDDFSLEYGPGPSSQAIPGGVPEEIPPGYDANPGGVPEVQGVSTIRSVLNVVLDWFRKD